MALGEPGAGLGLGGRPVAGGRLLPFPPFSLFSPFFFPFSPLTARPCPPQPRRAPATCAPAAAVGGPGSSLPPFAFPFPSLPSALPGAARPALPCSELPQRRRGEVR